MPIGTRPTITRKERPATSPRYRQPPGGSRLGTSLSARLPISRPGGDGRLLCPPALGADIAAPLFRLLCHPLAGRFQMMNDLRIVHDTVIAINKKPEWTRCDCQMEGAQESQERTQHQTVGGDGGVLRGVGPFSTRLSSRSTARSWRLKLRSHPLASAAAPILANKTLRIVPDSGLRPSSTISSIVLPLVATAIPPDVEIVCQHYDKGSLAQALVESCINPRCQTAPGSGSRLKPSDNADQPFARSTDDPAVPARRRHFRARSPPLQGHGKVYHKPLCADHCLQPEPSPYGK